ncbi:MAG: hypothetical protein WC813_04905 [Patescibacteria group bacterium]|jgi:hypothetical protein
MLTSEIKPAYFLQDIGVGVKVLCRFVHGGLVHNWSLERQDTKEKHTFLGSDGLPSPWLIVQGINLGLELQGKHLEMKGYTKLDEVKPFTCIYLAVTGEYSVMHPPIKSSKVRKIDLDHALHGMPVAQAILLGQEPLDGKTGNLAIVYQVAAIP